MQAKPVTIGMSWQELSQPTVIDNMTRKRNKKMSLQNAYYHYSTKVLRFQKKHPSM